MAHIVLIEPNAVLAATYDHALRQAGHSVKRVAGAQAAINAADQQAPDLVILEIQLAGHSGIEFLHEFRSYPEWQQVPVIINTAIQPAVLARARKALMEDLGVCAILYKPQATISGILQTVHEQLARA